MQKYVSNYLQDPYASLEYAKDLLSAEQLEYCVKKAPWKALEYAKDLLSAEQLEYCVNNS